MLALVADDDVPIQELMRRCLKRLGFAVKTVNTAEALLEASRRFKPDLIVSDVDMPGKLNGLEACRALRPEMRDAFIILITGNPASVAAVGKREFDLILLKPFRLEELEKAAARRLEQRA